MKFLALLCVCLSVATGTWAYSRDCAKGPEYWCRDASTAKDCGTVQHCEQTVWKEKHQPQKSSATGETAQMLCNVLVHASHELLAGSSVNADSIKEYLRQDCTKLPNQKNLVQQCQMAVDIYVADILRHLASGTELNKICSIIQGHDTSNVVVPKPKLSNAPTNLTCVICEFVVHLVETYASQNKSAQQIEHILEAACKEMPSVLRDECKSFVDSYGPDLIALLVREMDPDKVCAFIKVCKKSENAIVSPKPVKSIQCALCKYVVGYIDTVIQNNKTAAAVEAALEKVCTILPPSLKPGCVSFVDSYGPLLLQLILKFGTPEKVCNALKVCNNGTQEMPILEHVPMMNLQKPQLGTIPCTICKFVIGYLDTATKGNHSAAAVEAALDKVCNYLPGTLKDNCTAFVHKYGPIIAFMFLRNATAEQICDFIKVCNNGTQAMPLDIHQLSNILPSSVKSAECSLCKYIVGYIDTVIQSNKSEAAIEAALEKVCTILPAAIKPKCDQFVVTYGPVLIQLIQKYGTPELVCNALQMCHNGTESIRPAIKNFGRLIKSAAPTKVASVQCSLCKYVVGYVDTVIQNNKSAAAIEAALEKVCTILPASLKPGCVSFVDSYGPLLLQLIVKFGTPEKVCNALKICNNGTQEITPLSNSLREMLKSKQEPLRSAECSLCKYIVGYIDTVIQSNKSEAAIEAALEKVCTILPASIKPKCDQFVVTYGPVLIQLIQKYGTPELVCNALQMCHNGTESIRPAIKNFGRLIKSAAPAKVASIECALCKYIIGYIDGAIQNNKTEAAIEAALEKVCTVLPAAMKTGCESFVKTYGPLVFNMIIKFGTPEKVCHALKICHDETQTIESVAHNLVESIKKAKSGGECTLCKYVLSYVNLLITANSTEVEVEKALEVICTILPSEYHDKCDGFVHTYASVLVQLLAELDDPNTVCAWLDVCPKSKKEFIPIPALKTNKVKSLPCNLCQYVVNYAETILQSNTTEVKFEQALEKACKVLPSDKLQAECKTLVHLYGPDLIKYIIEYGDPKAVCQAIGLCEK